MTCDRQNAPGRADTAEWPALMRKAQDGDSNAYRVLLLSITPYLRAIVARSLSNPGDREDAVQDILLTVHEVRHTYDPARPFKPWVVAIARHRIVDRLRRRGRFEAREVSLAPEHETFAVPEANTGEAAFDRQALEQALGGLPEGQRRALTMLKLKEMSLQEAATASGMSVASLKVSTHRGIKALRRIMSREETS